MKAITYTQYGAPDVLKLEEVETPTPKDDEVLIQVRAASLNALDWHLLHARPALVRLSGGLFRPKLNRLGVDVAGIVAAIGRNVTQFQVGDEVFGTSQHGSCAEYVCALESRIATRPRNLSFPEAAAVPVAAITALQAVNAFGGIQPGQQVLINGSAGGVGTFTVQLAKAFGAQITAVCSTRNLDMVRSLGADRVLDYTRQDFTRRDDTYDFIVDNVGNRSPSELKRLLKPDGSCVIVGFTSMSRLIQAILAGRSSKEGGQRVRLLMDVESNKKDLETLTRLLETKQIAPVIDRCYPLNQVPKALAYVETGHARAKVVINLEPTQ
jgi:NADPH:quinone reductase-like Zn-dependent oxidoreductase